MTLHDSGFNHLGFVKPTAEEVADEWRSRENVTHVDVVAPDRLIVFYNTVTNGLGVREVFVP